MKRIKVLQLICPTGVYGAEMWLLALAGNLCASRVGCGLAVTQETPRQRPAIAEKFAELGLPVHIVRMRGRFDPSAVFAIARLLRREQVDIVHSHGYKSDILGLLAARLAGCKVVATPHGFENRGGIKMRIYMRAGLQALRFVDQVAPLSPELRDELARQKNIPRLHLIQNGLDLAGTLAPRRNGGARPPGDKVIGYVGQLIRRKNVAALIRTFDRLHRGHSRVRLRLIGDGAERGALQELAASLACAGKVEFLGYRPDRLELMLDFDLFCMTSIREGIPRAMMEAMALGVPVAAFNIPGIDQLLIPGKTGLLAEYGRTERLMQCWERLLFEPETARTLARNARVLIEEKFSAKRMAEEYETLYKELLTL